MGHLELEKSCHCSRERETFRVLQVPTLIPKESTGRRSRRKRGKKDAEEEKYADEEDKVDEEEEKDEEEE